MNPQDQPSTPPIQPYPPVPVQPVETVATQDISQMPSQASPTAPAQPTQPAPQSAPNISLVPIQPQLTGQTSLPTPSGVKAVEGEGEGEVMDETMQQVVDQLHGVKNVLITVKTNPTVDELASMIGLTLVLDRLGKHATAVYSGKTPPAIEFLKPNETLEETVDSLRDFIVALSTDKADKIRTKVEGDIVKIYITPYKTVVTDKDFIFSQGDYNVDAIVALGVEDRQELDKAILAHGRILHDAAVIAVNVGSVGSNLGSIDWFDPRASSIAEMLASMINELADDAFDEQSSTALLTGVVAETNRFSNDKTTPKAMNVAAQLMAAGANQQLVASNLREKGTISAQDQDESKTVDVQADNNEGELSLNHEVSNKNKRRRSKKSKGTKNETLANQVQAEPKLPEPEMPIEVPEIPPAIPTNPVEEAPKEAEGDDKIVQLQAALNEAAKEVEPKKSTDEMVATSVEPEEPEAPSENEIDNKAVESSSLPSASEEDLTLELPNQLADPSKPTVGGNRRIEPLRDEAEILEQRAGINSSLMQPDEAQGQPLAPAENDKPAIIKTPNREVSGKPTFGADFNATTAESEQAKAAEAEREASRNHTALSHDEAGQEDSTQADLAVAEQTQAIEDARKLVESVEEAQPFNPANKPTESIGAVEVVAPIHHEQTPDSGVQAQQAETAVSNASAATPSDTTVSQEDVAKQGKLTPDPMQAFMQSHADQAQPQMPNMPPLPPMPGGMTPAGDSGMGMPPLPPMPVMPGAPFDPQTAATQSTTPGFMQAVSQSQNPWSQAGDDLAKKQANETATREAELQKRMENYDQTVDQNRILQGQPPLNNPNAADQSTFPLPPTLSQ